FVWEGFRLLQETTWQGKRTYLYDAEQPYTPVAAVTGRGESRKIWYYHTDVTGTVQEVSAADGTLVWAGYQAGFGENRGDISNSGAYFEQPLRLPGQYFDEETGLHYNLFRYYAPECGRFISQDPIGLRGGLNLYAYAPNPLSWIDPFGLSACNAPGGYKKGDIDSHGSLSPGTNRAIGHGNNRSDGLIQSHHPIQDAWAQKGINGYKRNDAPGILLESSSGAPHANISAAQRGRRSVPGGWNTTLKHEFNKSYQEMINAGVPASQAKKAFKESYLYFDKLRDANKGNPYFDI
ncbi:RHS repeat-associated core domain-containing protein, partial [Escherichia marmotae]|nr:RHS repeat-associated core domain-containing protein [Escherichia marmotae]